MLKRGFHNNPISDIPNETTKQNCYIYNLVYGICCVKCQKKIYIGETSRSLKERAKEHEADVRLRRDKPISDHFNGAGHGVKDMGISVLTQIRDSSRYYRLIKELEFIKKYETQSLNGLNTKNQLDVLLLEII